MCSRVPFWFGHAGKIGNENNTCRFGEKVASIGTFFVSLSTIFMTCTTQTSIFVCSSLAFATIATQVQAMSVSVIMSS